MNTVDIGQTAYDEWSDLDLQSSGAGCSKLMTSLVNVR